MLPLPAFSLEVPDRLTDAVALAADGAKLLAGGTDLLPSLKHRLFSPAMLVSLSAVAELQGMTADDRGLCIGAGCPLAEVQHHPLVLASYPALAAACGTVGTHTIRAMGTIGGNVLLDTRCLYYNQPQGWRDSIGGCLKCEGSVCHVAPKGTGCYATQSADTVPALWLYDAVLELHSTAGVRELPVRELFDGADGRRWLRLQPGEVLVAIRLPPPRLTVLHRKVRTRAHIDYAQVLVAVGLGDDGAHAVVAAVGPAPVHVHTPRADDLEEAAYRAARPLSTHALASTWRKHRVRVEVRRALAELSVAPRR